MKFVSLRRSLVLPLFLSLIALFIIFQGFNEAITRSDSKNSLINHIQVLSTGVAMNLEASVMFEDQESALEVLNTFSADERVIFVNLSLPNNSSFAQYTSNDYHTNQLPKQVISSLQMTNNIYFEQKLVSKVPISIDGNVIGELLVIVDAHRLFDWSKTIQQSLFYLIMCTLAGLFLFYRIKTQVITPIKKLNDAILDLGNNEHQLKHVHVQDNNEIGNLVIGFNQMAEEISQRGIEITNTLLHLKQEKEYATEVIESAQYALIVTDSLGVIKLTNIQALTLFEKNSTEMEGRYIGDFLSLKKDMLQNTLAQELTLSGLRSFIENSKGENITLRITSSELPHQGLSLFTIEDVTVQEKLIRRQRLMVRVFDDSQEGLIVLNHQQQITMVNPAFVGLLGYSENELVGKTFHDIENWHQFRGLNDLAHINQEDFSMWQGEISEQHKDGYAVPLLVKVSRLTNIEVTAESDIVLIFSDISNVKEVERLDYLAHHDQLTSLGNRALLYCKIEMMLAKGLRGQFALIYLDLDGFKAINDHYGHIAGDKVLTSTADRLQELIRANDVVVRLGGDEFIIVQVETNDNGAVQLANRVIDSVSQPIEYEHRVLEIGVSVGVYLSKKESNETLDEMLHAADRAMYMAKAQGKGRVVNLYNAS